MSVSTTPCRVTPPLDTRGQVYGSGCDRGCALRVARRVARRVTSTPGTRPGRPRHGHRFLMKSLSPQTPSPGVVYYKQIREIECKPKASSDSSQTLSGLSQPAMSTLAL